MVASYNVQNYLPMDRRVDGRVHRNSAKPEREVNAVIRVLQQVRPDILGLVEMGDEAMLDDFQNRLKAAGLNYPHREWLKGADDLRHVCLLSRFPIVARNSRDNVPFELNGRRHRMTRGILDVTVQVTPTYRLRLVGAHLKSRREVADYDQAWLRAKEAWYLRDHLNRILAAQPAVNLLVFGDFNDTKNEYPVRELIGVKGQPNYLMDLWLKDSRGERWTFYWKTADEYSRIDYLLASPGLAREVVLSRSGINDAPFWNEASDHRAIYAAINAKERP